MDLDQFSTALMSAAPEGTVLQNPGGGTTTIVGYTAGRLRYQRGHSTMYVSLRDFYEAYRRFRGRTVTSADLRAFAPKVFDSKAPYRGHSCNCTVFFMLLQRTGIVHRIGGGGVRGDPFFVRIPA